MHMYTLHNYCPKMVDEPFESVEDRLEIGDTVVGVVWSEIYEHIELEYY